MKKLLALCSIALMLFSCETGPTLSPALVSATGNLNETYFNQATILKSTDPYKALPESIYVDGKLDALQIHVISPEKTLGIAITNSENAHSMTGLAFINEQGQWRSFEVHVDVLKEGTPGSFDFELEEFRFGENYRFAVYLPSTDPMIDETILEIEGPYFP